MTQGRKSAGHPVDIGTGTLYSTHEDISIPGKVALTWERRYSTALLENPPSPLGPGWTTRYFATLTRQPGEFVLVTPEGETETFADPDNLVDQGEVVRNFGTFQELAKRDAQYVVTRWNVDNGTVERFVFNSGRPGDPWRLASIEDVTGQGLDLSWDSNGRLNAIRQRLEQRTLKFAYTPENRIASVSVAGPNHPRQVMARYEYGQTGRLTAAYDALNHPEYYEYDPAGRMVREFLKSGAVFQFRFDSQGRCIRSLGTDGYDEKNFRYLDAIRWTEITDSNGEVWRYQWLPTGQIVTEVDPLGGTKENVYDEFLRIVQKTDANGGTTQYEYDAQGNYAKITDALGQTSLFAHNDRHQSIGFTNNAGSVWRRFFDPNYRLIGTENPEGARYRLAYDGKGNLSEITDPLGNRLALSYTEWGDLATASDWEGHITRYRTDGLGRVTETVDALGNSTGFQYDVLDHLSRIDYPDGTHEAYRYDSAGNLIHILDRNGFSTQFKYGTCGRLVERVDPQGLKIRFGWGNEPDQLKTVTNPKGEVYHFEYSPTGWVTREIGFDGRELTFEYDPAGNRVTSVNGLGQRIAYQRDGLGRLLGQELPDGAPSKFIYDDAGFLIQAQNADSDVRFERDRVGRIVREIQNGHVLERSFDAVGDLLQLKSASGDWIDYQFDANSRLRRFSINGQGETVLERDARGSETRRLLPGRTSLDQRYDGMGRLIEQTLFPPSAYDSPKALIQRNYVYEKAHLVGIEDQHWGKSRYVYDPSERLLQALREKGVSENFRYDENDNITVIEKGEEREDLSYGPGDRLLSKGTTFYDYDGQGRLVEKREGLPDGGIREWRYEWDSLDQLRAVINPEGERWEYKYDPFGRRIEKVAPDGRRLGFVWDEDVVFHELLNGDVTVSWAFDPHSFSPLCKLENEQVYSVINDHLGTPRGMVDRFGRVVWRGDYFAWGEVREKKAGNVDCPVRFQGQWFDEESGLHYNRFRYFGPEIGQFICCDPIGLAGGINEYQYALNPVSWIDPWGLNGCGDDASKEETTRVRHYTNRKGSKGIEQDGVIKARDNNRVYVEPANKKPLSQVEAETKYQIGKGRGRDYVETDVPNSQLDWVPNPRYGRLELTVKGDLPLQNSTVVRRK